MPGVDTRPSRRVCLHIATWNLLFHRRKLPHTRVNCAKFSIRNFGCRWILAVEDTPGPMQDAGRTVQPLGKCMHRAEQRRPGVHPPGPAINTCVAHSTLSTRERGTARVSPRTDLHIDSCSYANLVLGSLMMLPDDAFRRLSVRCGLGPISPTDRHLSSNCVLCGA